MFFSKLHLCLLITFRLELFVLLTKSSFVPDHRLMNMLNQLSKWKVTKHEEKRNVHVQQKARKSFPIIYILVFYMNLYMTQTEYNSWTAIKDWNLIEREKMKIHCYFDLVFSFVLLHRTQIESTCVYRIYKRDFSLKPDNNWC